MARVTSKSGSSTMSSSVMNTYGVSTASSRALRPAPMPVSKGRASTVVRGSSTRPGVRLSSATTTGPANTFRTLASMRRSTAGRSKVLTTRVRVPGSTGPRPRRPAHAAAAADSTPINPP